MKDNLFEGKSAVMSLWQLDPFSLPGPPCSQKQVRQGANLLNFNTQRNIWNWAKAVHNGEMKLRHGGEQVFNLRQGSVFIATVPVVKSREGPERQGVQSQCCAHLGALYTELPLTCTLPCESDTLSLSLHQS